MGKEGDCGKIICSCATCLRQISEKGNNVGERRKESKSD